MADELNRARDDMGEHLGSRIRLTKAALLDGAFAAALRTLLVQRGVLVFPQVGFTAEEQIAFTRTLGDYVPDKPDGGVTPISIAPGGGRASRYAESSFLGSRHRTGRNTRYPFYGVTPQRKRRIRDAEAADIAAASPRAKPACSDADG